MITKVQEKRLPRTFAVHARPRLTPVERGMIRWAAFDPEDKVLDVGVGSGVMAETLRRNMLCEVCGVSDHMECVRMARSRLQNCDIVYAQQGDIPWREGAFDSVLMRIGTETEDIRRRMLAEALRVLKDGGQLVLGVPCFPAHLQESACADSRFFRKAPLCAMLTELGFGRILWQRTGLVSGVMIAWKANSPEVEALRSQT